MGGFPAGAAVRTHLLAGILPGGDRRGICLPPRGLAPPRAVAPDGTGFAHVTRLGAFSQYPITEKGVISWRRPTTTNRNRKAFRMRTDRVPLLGANSPVNARWRLGVTSEARRIIRIGM